MTPIAADERLKGGIHGLLLGCVLPVLAYNAIRRNKLNSGIYFGIVILEIWHIAGHLKCANADRAVAMCRRVLDETGES